jgi:ABC-type methionine transport system permease subunit
MVVGYASECVAVQLSGRRTAAGTIGVAFGLGPYDYNYSIQHVHSEVRCALSVVMIPQCCDHQAHSSL